MSIHGGMDKPNWSVHTMEYCSAIKRNEGLIYAKPWMNLKNITHSEKSQTQKAAYCMIHMKCLEQGTHRAGK